MKHRRDAERALPPVVNGGDDAHEGDYMYRPPLTEYTWPVM